MNLIEKGYLYKIKHIMDEFVISNRENNKDMTVILYTTFLIEKLYVANPLDESCYINDTILKASLSLKLYKIIQEVDSRVYEIFGKNELIDELLSNIFIVVDFNGR